MFSVKYIKIFLAALLLWPFVLIAYHKWSFDKISVVINALTHFISDVFIVIFVNLPLFFLLLRFIWMILLYKLCAPEYTYCMEMDIADYYNSINEVDSRLSACQVQMHEILIAWDQELIDKAELQTQITVLLDQIQSIQNEMQQVQTGHFDPLNDLLQEIHNLNLDLSVQRKVLISHENVLSKDFKEQQKELNEVPDSFPSLWEQLNKIRWTSNVALATSVLALGIFSALITGPKN